MLRTFESKISRRGMQGQFTRMVFGPGEFFAGVVKSIQHQMLSAPKVSQLSREEGGECVGHWPRLRIPRNGCQVRMLRRGYNVEPSEAGAFQCLSELAPFIINAIRHQCVVSVKFPEVSRPRCLASDMSVQGFGSSAKGSGFKMKLLGSTTTT